VRDEPIRHRVLLVQQADHLLFADEQDIARRDRRGGSHAKRLPCQAALAEKVAGTEHRDDGFPSELGQH
jgi:hypothetical protein